MLRMAAKYALITLFSMQCGLASYYMEEIGMVYSPPEDPRIVGITVKDCTTSGYVFFLYKCTVKDFECEVSFYNHKVHSIYSCTDS